MKNNNENLDILKKIVIVIIILLILAIIITGIVVTIQNNLSNNTTNNETSVKYQKIDDKKDFIYIKKGNVYEVNFNESNRVSFDYPIININTNSVKEVNDTIKKQFNNLEKDYRNINNSDNCTCINMDGKDRCDKYINSLHYVTIEDSDYYEILLYSFRNSNCTIGNSDLKGYVISSKTGEVLSNKEIIEYFEYDTDKLLQKYNEYKQNEYLGVGEKFNNITDINDLSILIYNDKLILINHHPSVNIYMPLLFDGNAFSIYNDLDDPIVKYW